MTQPPTHSKITTTTTTAATKKSTNRSRSGPKQPATTTTASTLLIPLATAPGISQPSLAQKLEDSSNASTKQQHSVTGSSSEADDGGTNPYLSLVFRRIRRLKKRMTRVESTEAALNLDPSKKSKLEPEQLVALEKKLEISAPLKELEDLLNAMTVQQAKDKREQKQQIERHLQDIQRAQEIATKEAQESTTTAFIQLTRLCYALKQLNEAKEYLTSPLLNSLKVLEKFQTCLFEVAQGAELLDEDDCAHSRKELFSMVHKLGEKCTDNVAEDGDITYKLIYDELDHVTHPSACQELKDVPLVPDNRQEPSQSTGESQTVKADDDDKASVGSLLSEPSSMVTQKSCATVESWFNKLSASTTNPSSASPPKSTPGPRTEALPQATSKEQAESIPITEARACREVASQTDPVASSEPPSSLPAGTPMPPNVVPLVPVHPIPEYPFVFPPWIEGSSYPADPHMVLPPAQQALPSMNVSNEPGHSAVSQSDEQEYGNGGSHRRFGHSTGGYVQYTSGARVQRVPQESHGHSGDGRQLGVIYEVEEKDYSSISNVAVHGKYVSDCQGPIYQEPEQLQVVDPKQRGIQDRVVASTMAESVSPGFRRGAPLMSSGDQMRQQGFGRSSETTLRRHSESTNKVVSNINNNINKESTSDSNNGGDDGVQVRRSGKKKGRSQNRSPQGQTQHGGTKNLDQRSTESSSLIPLPQQQHSNGSNNQYLPYQQHSVSRPYECSQHNNAQSQQQQYRFTSYKSQQPIYQQQQGRYNERQHQQQQQQQGVHRFVQQQPYVQYPSGWYYPGHGGGRSVYYVQGQQEEQQGQKGSLAERPGEGL